MRKCSVLIVDDEEEVVRVIEKKIDWDSMGLEMIGYARNGVEALEMAEELLPDIVLSDIKMPYMDGLTLCRKLKELYKNIKVIIFSGFDEFEYAKEAIKIEAEEYILKPINSYELTEVFTRVKENLCKELNEKQNFDNLRSYYMESLPVLQENFYTLLLEGRMKDNQIETYMKNYQIEFHGKYYVVCVVHLSMGDNTDEPLNAVLMAMSVKQLLEEQLDKKWNSKTVIYLGEVVVISELDKVENIARYTDAMDIMSKMIKRVCNVKVTAGIGHVCNELGQLQLSYQGAKSAVSYRVIYGNTRAINIAEIAPQENTNIQWEEPYIQQLQKKIRMGNEQVLKEVILEFIHKIKETKMSLQKYQVLIMELIAELFRFGNDNLIDIRLVFGENCDIYSQALQLDTPEALGKWLINYCTKMQQLFQKERQVTTQSFVSKAIEFVEENYADKDLSIESVCQYLNVSASYFSTVFKKEKGNTFINYLTDYRMKQAEELLIEENEKTYVIADRVGYADPNYFSYVFKKKFGMSPSKYKLIKQGKNTS